MKTLDSILSSALALSLVAVGALSCGKGATSPNGVAVHDCGEKDKVHAHDLSGDAGSETFVPCSKGGADDYSGKIRIENTADGVHIHIEATDDEVNEGELGSEVKERDAVIVYPKGRDHKAVEIPLVKTATGYTADKVIKWEELDSKLTDEGAKIDVAIFDHDKENQAPAEEMHLSVAVSTGMSCEKAKETIGQTVDMGAKGKPARDLIDEELGAPLKGGAYLNSCNVPSSAAVDVCAFIVRGKPVGVSVSLSPANNKAAACVDRLTRRMSFPVGSRNDTVTEHFAAQ